MVSRRWGKEYLEGPYNLSLRAHRRGGKLWGGGEKIPQTLLPSNPVEKHFTPLRKKDAKNKLNNNNCRGYKRLNFGGGGGRGRGAAAGDRHSRRNGQNEAVDAERKGVIGGIKSGGNNRGRQKKRGHRKDDLGKALGRLWRGHGLKYRELLHIEQVILKNKDVDPLF